MLLVGYATSKNNEIKIDEGDILLTAGEVLGCYLLVLLLDLLSGFVMFQTVVCY